VYSEAKCTHLCTSDSSSGMSSEQVEPIRCCSISRRVHNYGTVGAAFALSVVSVLEFLNPVVDLSELVAVTPICVHVYILLLSAMMAACLLLHSKRLLGLFGFMEHLAGAGACLVLTGALAFDMYQLVGKIVAIVSMSWGCAGIGLHVVSPSEPSPPSEPLLGSAPEPERPPNPFDPNFLVHNANTNLRVDP